MNVPLDQLYHFIETQAEKIYGSPALIYRFWPHGSKNIQNLRPLNNQDSFFKSVTSPIIYCHDQEPLMYDYYKIHLYQRPNNPLNSLLPKLGLAHPVTNLNYMPSTFAKNILLHSEKNSPEVEKYEKENQLFMVYYWSHALIARDWYRFAQHVDFKKQVKKTFLVYNRSWTGTREYRIKFADLLIEKDLLTHCVTFFNPQDADTQLNYHDHVFFCTDFKPQHQLEKYLSCTSAGPNSSADFDKADYSSTEIEVVLETVFNDRRWHLTEKILRPIACGQPFILAGTAGSLKYLREYGFKTFDTVWSEDYDNQDDPIQRLNAITSLMQHLATLDDRRKQHVMQQAQKIAAYNRSLFFSQGFFDKIVDELKTNLAHALDAMKIMPIDPKFVERYQKILKNDSARDLLSKNSDLGYPSLTNITQVLELAKRKLQA